jgi:hypothetical protein
MSTLGQKQAAGMVNRSAHGCRKIDARDREWRQRCSAECHLRLNRQGITLHAATGNGWRRNGRSRERNYNIYSLTWAECEGRGAKI